jgi:hypothetical protein
MERKIGEAMVQASTTFDVNPVAEYIHELTAEIDALTGMFNAAKLALGHGA